MLGINMTFILLIKTLTHKAKLVHKTSQELATTLKLFLILKVKIF